MFERYPSNKNLDVAYQGDFEDAAWSKFSEAQLPPPRVTLEDFAKHPFVAGEITSKSDYVRHVVTWFSKALKDAGYKESEVDGLIAKSLDAIDFNRPAEAYVADINRIIQNFYQAAPGIKTPAVEKPVIETPVSPLAPTQQPTRAVDDAVPPEVIINTKVPNLGSTSSIENISEAENSLATEFDDRAQEYAEYGNRPITLVRPEPQFASASIVATSEAASQVSEVKSLEKLILNNQLPETQTSLEANAPLILTPEMQVVDSNEPIVLEAIDTSTPEKLDVASEYQNKLDALNAQPFNHGAYVEYVFDVHTGLRHTYDEVITAARTNLKRFDGFYAPSTVEKQALQLLSSLQGQYAKMQNSESDYGLIRDALTEKMSTEPTEAIEADIKKLSQDYLDATKKLFANIDKLEGLIEVVKTEEKPSVAEVYRAQFEKMQTEGNQVLQSLPASHPLYERLKTAIESDLADLIKNAAIENGGDTAVLQNSSNFMARRDQIKNLIAFVKQEQELQDYFDRARIEVQKLESEFEHLPNTDAGVGIKKMLAENIVKIKQALAETTSQIATVGVLENLEKQKNSIKGMIGESKVLLESLPEQGIMPGSPTEPEILSDEGLAALIAAQSRKSEINGALDRYEERKNLVPFFEEYQRRMHERNLKALESSSNREKIVSLVKRIPLAQIGKAAAVVLALAGPAGQSGQKVNNPILGGPLLSSSVLSQPEVDYAGISEFLRIAEANEITLVPNAPFVPTATPEPLATSVPIETVPGVILPDTVSSPNQEVDDTPLEIFSDDADSVPSDPGIVFESPKSAEVKKLGNYLLNYGDIFWDINEGQTLAGKLPVMSQINPYFKQALIDRVRDRINKDNKVRESIGGFGKDTTRPYADQLVTGQYMNLDALNELAISIAVEYGYLK